MLVVATHACDIMAIDSWKGSQDARQRSSSRRWQAGHPPRGRLVTGAPETLSLHDPVNEAILAVSEDRLDGFRRDPIGDIASLSGVPEGTVIDRIRGLLGTGAIRRVRQTLLTHNLAEGALIAWRFPADRVDGAFTFMSRDDPFTGHVVIRESETGGPAGAYQLWTTLKVPRGVSVDRHCAFLKERTGASEFRLLPAKAVFVLGVGHTRRRDIQPGERSDQPAGVMYPQQADLDETEWSVLFALKREFGAEEIVRDIWAPRAAEAGLSLDRFFEVAGRLDARHLLGRFSTFLEHTRPAESGESAGLQSALLQWAVPSGRELDAGREVGRHPILTHLYWRIGGPDLGDANIMGMVHTANKDAARAHEAAIRTHLEEDGIPVARHDILWSLRADIKPSEIDPAAYRAWAAEIGLSVD